MAEIIEQENVESLLGNSLVAFQTTDLKALAAKILRRANEVAQQKVAAAAQTAAAQEKKAYDAGLAKGTAEGEKKGEAAGRAAGEKAAREEFSKTVAGVAEALKNAIGELNKRKMQLQADAEADMLHLAMAIAKRIVRHEISLNESAVLPIVREAISLCNNRSDLSLRLNPADVRAVEQEIPELKAAFTDIGRVDISEDAKIERGGVLLQNRTNAVDLRLARQFAALERALAGSDNSPFEHLPEVGEMADSSAPVAETAVSCETAAAPENFPEDSATVSAGPEETVLQDSADEIPVTSDATPDAAPENIEKIPADTAIPSAENPVPASAPAAVPPPAPEAAAAPAPARRGGLSGLHSLRDLTADAATEAAINAALHSR